MGQHFRNRYNEVDLENIIDDYINGKKSCMEIGLDYDMGQSTIRKLLIKNGVQLRPSGRQKTRDKIYKPDKTINPMGNHRISYDKIQEGIKSYTNNKFSLTTLSLFWGCSITSVRKILEFHKVEPHTHGWRSYRYLESA